MEHKATRTRYLAVVAAVAVLVGASGCVTPSLQRPEPNEPGEVSVGAHASVPAGGELDIENADEFPGWVTGTVNVGVTSRMELGMTAGFTGLYANLKYGLTESGNDFQASLIGGLGYWGPFLFFASGSAIPSVDIGALAGYDIIEQINLYGGYRQYFTGQLAESDLATSVLIGNVIGGIELFPEAVVSLPLELNYNLTRIRGEFQDT
ncbi:MAG: hypothetical protein ACLFUM_11910, partial [Spirochaetaceae bacterium]